MPYSRAWEPWGHDWRKWQSCSRGLNLSKAPQSEQKEQRVRNDDHVFILGVGEDWRGGCFPLHFKVMRTNCLLYPGCFGGAAEDGWNSLDYILVLSLSHPPCVRVIHHLCHVTWNYLPLVWMKYMSSLYWFWVFPCDCFGQQNVGVSDGMPVHSPSSQDQKNALGSCWPQENEISLREQTWIQSAPSSQADLQ